MNERRAIAQEPGRGLPDFIGTAQSTDRVSGFDWSCYLGHIDQALCHR
jgi:hypothetical protein